MDHGHDLSHGIDDDQDDHSYDDYYDVIKHCLWWRLGDDDLRQGELKGIIWQVNPPDRPDHQHVIRRFLQNPEKSVTVLPGIENAGTQKSLWLSKIGWIVMLQLFCEAVALLSSERQGKADLNSLWHSVRLTRLLPLRVRLCSLQKEGGCRRRRKIREDIEIPMFKISC